MSPAAGLFLTLPKMERLKIEYVLQLRFKASNNKAKYKAFLVGMRLA